MIDCNICRLLTGSILAHEMMHAWLRLNGEMLLPAIVTLNVSLFIWSLKNQFGLSSTLV